MSTVADIGDSQFQQGGAACARARASSRSSGVSRRPSLLRANIRPSGVLFTSNSVTVKPVTSLLVPLEEDHFRRRGSSYLHEHLRVLMFLIDPVASIPSLPRSPLSLPSRPRQPSPASV